MLHRLAAALLTGSLLLGLGGNASVSGIEPAIGARVAQNDTVRASMTAEEPLILTLPSVVGDHEVDEYRMLHGPSLSGVAGRSFTWIPQNVAPGTYDIRLSARHADTASDTLVVRIDVQPES